MANSLTIEKIDAAYGAVRVLEDVSLKVNGGETVVLLGTNGNGKSTLMKCVMGIVRPRAGRIVVEIDGEQARSGRPHDRGDRRSRHRAGAGGPPPVPAAHGRGESAARRLPPQGARRSSNRNLAFLLRDASRGWPSAAASSPAAMSGGEQQMLALGARADAGAAHPADRRAVGGPRAGAGEPHHRQDQGAQGSATSSPC